MTRDPFEVLGVPEDASLQDIKRAYREKVKTHHPDRDKTPGAALRFQEIQAAYEWLRNPDRNTRPRPEGQSARSEATHAPKKVVFLRCEGCHSVTPHLRLLVLRHPSFNTERLYAEVEQHLLCPGCARRIVRQVNVRWVVVAAFSLPVMVVFPPLVLFWLYQLVSNTLWAFAAPSYQHRVLVTNVARFLESDRWVEAYHAASAAVPLCSSDLERRHLIEVLAALRASQPHLKAENPWKGHWKVLLEEEGLHPVLWFLVLVLLVLWLPFVFFPQSF